MALIIMLILGVATAMIANSKGRSAVGWFFIGFLLGLIGLIICLCMSNLNEERQYREQQGEENRRLREKIRQEQMKLESLRMHTADRLDQHDRALDMDTRRTVPQALGAGYGYAPALAPPPMPPDAPAAIPAYSGDADKAIWYLVIHGQQYGPVSQRTLGSMISTGQVNRDTLIWQESMPNWIEVSKVPELGGLFV
ncbi:MAG TPA: GYF domain-containing protein [Verrucomicrobiales bacterium]|nr:GYF domain-containing protein [Verrucomicrobiales bacterium]